MTCRNILITGAAGALGSALALECARRGARVLLLDRDLRGLEQLCDQVESVGAQGPGYCQLDLAEAGPEQCEALLQQLRDAYGPIDALVHCAARFHALQPLDQVAPKEWLQSVQVNLNSAWLLSVACLPDLRKQPGARLVFTTDTLAAEGRAYWGPYGVSKAGQQALAQMFAEELEGSACRVFAVDPGPMRSPLRATAYHAEHPAAVATADHAAAFFADLLFQEAEPGAVLLQVPAA
jgi:NAD(P)-dependent dehydrogenase (short-subunit alcohol dehydrogenase family)